MNISKETFEKEINMCRKLARENGEKCNWGECGKCGVIPLLYKLHKGQFLEGKAEIKEAKKILQNKKSDPHVARESLI
jgi:hypothetical protein